tara:strand:- start:310 stop:588 length:279 start_codon:yes stop_codon:yes gene_type:complete
MEVCYTFIFSKKKVYFEESGIRGVSELFSSICSITDRVSCRSALDKTTKEILETINKVATIPVNFVNKLPTERVDAKLSCEIPNPSAPPSDL